VLVGGLRIAGSLALISAAGHCDPSRLSLLSYLLLDRWHESAISGEG